MKYLLEVDDGEYRHDFIVWTNELITIQKGHGICIGKNVIEFETPMRDLPIKVKKLTDKK